jgi:aromatic ring-opening dioxygenase catalytic subunit (LigB family)
VILVTIVVLMAPKAVGVTVEVSVAPNLAAMVSTMLARAMTNMINVLTTLEVVVVVVSGQLSSSITDRVFGLQIRVVVWGYGDKVSHRNSGRG